MALIKLKIESYANSDCSGSPLGSIDALINPEAYSRDYKVRYDNPAVIGDSANTSFFASMGSSVLSLKRMLVDGTGVIPMSSFAAVDGVKSVDAYIQNFGKVVYAYNGDLHRPPYVMVTWGNLTFKGVCSSFNVEYKLFNPDGTALRAYIDLELTESKDFKTKEAQAANNSPDLSHKRTVRAGDTLALMTYNIYGNSNYYLKVAEFNNLDSVTSIQPGDDIIFPPIKK